MNGTMMGYGCNRYQFSFPMGAVDLMTRDGKVKLSLKEWTKHMLALDDDAFRVHHSFAYMAFDIQQRQAVSWATKMVLSRKAVQRQAVPVVGSMTSDDIKQALANIKGRSLGKNDVAANAALKLLKSIGQHVNLEHCLFGTWLSSFMNRFPARSFKSCATGASCTHRSTILVRLPSLSRINPADLDSPILQVLHSILCFCFNGNILFFLDNCCFVPFVPLLYR